MKKKREKKTNKERMKEIEDKRKNDKNESIV